MDASSRHKPHHRPLDDIIAELTELPPCARLLLTNYRDKSYENGSSAHHQAVREVVPYIVQLSRYAFASSAIKRNLRMLLGLDLPLCGQLRFLKLWQPLRKGCKAHLKELGDTLQRIYKEQNLSEVLGSYRPPLAQTPPKQFIPPQCDPSTFSGRTDTVIRELDQEHTYIHFLRMIALALDKVFQESVREVLRQAQIDAVVYSGGIKGYERMVNKMKSEDDHRRLVKPRASANIDIVRCLVTLDTVSGMQHAFDVLQQVFVDRQYVKFKNGMNWDNDYSEERHHLRIVLATGRVVHPTCRSIGTLRDDAAIQKIWKEYVTTETIPPTMSRNEWRRHVGKALVWLNELEAETEVSMLCEVQMLLKDYQQVRSQMHEIYKIVRAESPTALVKDFVKYERQRQQAERFKIHSASNFLAACRNGSVQTLHSLTGQNAGVSSGTENLPLMEGLKIACTYARAACVENLLHHVNDEAVLSEALRLSVGTQAGRANFELDDDRAVIVRLMLSAKADPNTKDSGGNNAVSTASVGAYPLALQVLLAAKGNPNNPNKSGTTPLIWASEFGHVEETQILLEAKADPNQLKRDKHSPLMNASSKGFPKVVKLLLAAKASLDTFKIVPPLYIAAKFGHLEVVKILLDVKCHVSGASHHGWTALLGACIGGYSDVVECLLEAKANVNHQAGSVDVRLTAAMLCSCEGHCLALRFLCEARADINLVEADGNTALAFAAREGKRACVDILLEAKADVHAGKSPLCLAAANGYHAVVQALLFAKANVVAGNGENALETAQCNGNTAIAELLQQAQSVTPSFSENSEKTSLPTAGRH